MYVYGWTLAIDIKRSITACSIATTLKPMIDCRYSASDQWQSPVRTLPHHKIKKSLGLQTLQIPTQSSKPGDVPEQARSTEAPLMSFSKKRS